MADVVAVDLAAKYSAACRFEDGYVQPTWQADSWSATEHAFLTAITDFWLPPEYFTPGPDVLVVEDLPHRLPFANLVKRVCRMQGRIAERMETVQQLDKLLYVAPAVWRKHFKGLERGTGPEAVIPVARDIGYFPPDLTPRIKKAGDKAIAKKVTTDYAAAFLIGVWAQDMHHRYGTFDGIPGADRYTYTGGKRG